MEIFIIFFCRPWLILHVHTGRVFYYWNFGDKILIACSGYIVHLYLAWLEQRVNDLASIMNFTCILTLGLNLTISAKAERDHISLHPVCAQRIEWPSIDRDHWPEKGLVMLREYQQMEPIHQKIYSTCPIREHSGQLRMIFRYILRISLWYILTLQCKSLPVILPLDSNSPIVMFHAPHHLPIALPRPLQLSHWLFISHGGGEEEIKRHPTGVSSL